MKFNNVVATDVIAMLESSTELFKLNKYKSKEIVEEYIGLVLNKSSFYGQLHPDGSITKLATNQIEFNEATTPVLVIEGHVKLSKLPVNIGSGDITLSGYGLIEVGSEVVYDGRGGLNTGSKWFTTDGTTIIPRDEPSVGDYLFNTISDTLFKYVNDGASDFWFDISTSSSSDNFPLFGWQDFADDGTSEGSPIQQTNVLGGSVQLTNNNQGVLTDGNTNLNSATTLSGVTDILDSTFGTLEFSNRGLEVNDTFLMRVNLNVSVNTIPSELFVDLKFYDDINGTGNLVFTQSTQFLSINDTAGFFKDGSILMSFFLGESIKEGSCVLDLRGSTAFDVEVIGYNIQINRK